MHGNKVESIPSIHSLRAFEVASRHANFRAAADELGVTQGAVAQHIRGLEAALGLKLFDRHPRSVILTEQGRGYAASVRRALELLIEATRSLQPRPLNLTISVTPTFASKWLLPRLPAFTESHPGVDLRILATDRISHFGAEGVDLAVRYGRPPFGPGLNAELLFEDVLIAVASPRLLQRYGRPDVALNLSRYALMHDSHNRWPTFLEKLASQERLAAVKNIRFNQTALAIDAAVAGQGLALAPKQFVATDIAAGRLVRAFRAEMRTEAGYYLVSPRRTRQSDPLAHVRSYLLKHR